jgi:hypothetical protein
VNVQHSNTKANWGTAAVGCELARGVLGAIDLDPASDSYWNYWTVKAKTFFDEEMNGLAQPWFGRVFLNPPGKTEDNPNAPGPRDFWDKLVEEYTAGNVTSAVYLGFSLEQACQLQASPVHPLQFFTLVPLNRMRFLERPHTEWCPSVDPEVRARLIARGLSAGPLKKAIEAECRCGRSGTGPPENGDSPTHGNFITLLHDQTNPGRGAAQLAAMVEWASRTDGLPGAIVRPH